jgi:hypothetical protein
VLHFVLCAHCGSCAETQLPQCTHSAKCRLCVQFDETTDHVISACPILAKELYIKRRDTVRAQVHF